MAGIFDYLGGSSNVNTVQMTPEQIRALQAYQAGQAPVPRAAPTQTWMPPQEAIGNTQPRIGVDPVAVQEQSGTRAAQAGRTFYANTAGQMGTQVPAGSGTSGMYAAEEAVEQGAKRGIMGRLGGAVLGAPGMGVQAMLNSENVGEGSELTPAQREAKNPGEQADASKYAQHVQELARQAASSPAATNLIDPNTDVDNPTDVAAAQQAVNSVQQPAAVNTPMGKATQANPVTVEQAAAKTAQDTEIKRQTLEQGALKGLATGAVSRPKFAEAVVEADVARSGQQLTPEAKKKAVVAELSNMKSMDNADLSKYLSYALIAGGVLAVIFDKSGRAAEGFAQGLNAQLDRNLKMGIQNSKMAQEQAKLNQAMAIQQGEWKRDDRGLDIKEKGVQQVGKYNDARIGIAQDGVEIDRGRLSLSQQSEGRQAAQGSRGLSLREMALQRQQANDDRDYELNVRRVGQGDTANAIRAAKAAKGTTSQGVALTEKGAQTVIKDFADAQGVKLEGNAKSALASQVQQESKNNPEWRANPAKVMSELLNRGGYTVETDPGIPFVPFTGGGPRIKQKKQ